MLNSIACKKSPILCSTAHYRVPNCLEKRHECKKCASWNGFPWSSSHTQALRSLECHTMPYKQYATVNQSVESYFTTYSSSLMDESLFGMGFSKAAELPHHLQTSKMRFINVPRLTPCLCTMLYKYSVHLSNKPSVRCKFQTQLSMDIVRFAQFKFKFKYKEGSAFVKWECK